MAPSRLRSVATGWLQRRSEERSGCLWRPDVDHDPAAIAPEAALTSTFRESLTGPLPNIIVRSWGVLIWHLPGHAIATAIP
jgi:hypothetical protein